MPRLEPPTSLESISGLAIVRLAIVAATVLAGLAVAWVETDPVAATESRFLALLAGGVLACMAFLSPPPARELAWTAMLVVTTVWVVGYGPHRGALVTFLLLGALALAAARASRDGSGILGSPGRSAALCLGLQLLVRSDLLLPPLLDLRTLVSVLALPTASGVALVVLAQRFGAPAAWLAGAASFALSPGWNVTVTLALTSLAAGVVLERSESAAMPRAAAAAALLVPPVWDPALGTLFVIGALSFLAEGRLSWLLSMAGIAVLAWSPPQRFGTELISFWLLGLVLLPGVAAAPREGRHLVLRGVFLSLVAAILGGGPEGLAGGLALAAMGWGRRRKGDELACAQAAWTTILALGTALLATYPWMRREPLHGFLELLGLDSPRWAFLAAVVAVLGIGGALLFVRPRLPRAPRGALAVSEVVVVVAVAMALLRALPSTVMVPISFKPVVLRTEPSTWFYRLDGATVSGGVIDCHLMHGAELEVGTRVATLRLRDAENKLIGDWDLRAGLDTAEWAAARDDVAGRPGFRAPDPWVHQVTSEGPFFLQRFRARFRLSKPVQAVTMAIRRDADLPPGVELAIYYVELRR